LYHSAASPRRLPLSWQQVHAFRMRQHHLAPRAQQGALTAVVADVCGVQAQVMVAAQLSLWARVQRITREDVQRALWQERTLVKTWLMRGTLHLLPVQELPLYLKAFGQAVTAREQQWMRRCGMTDMEATMMVEAIAEVLTERPMTRHELADRVVARLGPGARPWIEHSWGGIIKLAALQGAICFGPDRSQEVTFMRTDRWLSMPAELSPDEARLLILRKYLHAYGPATAQDFAGWAGMAVREATFTWEQIHHELIEVMVEGKSAFLLAEDLAVMSEEIENDLSVCLLPSFDVYMLAHRSKVHLLAPAHYQEVYRAAGWISPVIVARGQVVGIWSFKRVGKKRYIIARLFRDHHISVSEDRLQRLVSDLSDFLGEACELILT